MMEVINKEKYYYFKIVHFKKIYEILVKTKQRSFLNKFTWSYLRINMTV